MGEAVVVRLLLISSGNGCNEDTFFPWDFRLLIKSCSLGVKDEILAANADKLSMVTKILILGSNMAKIRKLVIEGWVSF